MTIEQLYTFFQQYPVITTDSRHCPQGSIFFALKGDSFDGNDYIEQALQSGSAYAVGDRKDLPENGRIIRVENVLQTLQALANYHRKQMNATIIAITGTNGKTTTKELIATALSSQFSTLYTQGNLNNHIGVPLTLLQLKPEHAFAVIEMGANHQGEIRDLCQIAEPDYGLITNIGKAHLEGFGSLEGVVRTKTELYDFLRTKNGTVFANLDHLILKDLYAYLSTVYYGTTSEDLIHGKTLQSEPALVVEWEKGNEKHEIATHLAGNYNLENVLAAVCVADYFGVGSAKISQAIQDYVPTNNRSQSQETQKNHLIIDAYNANPSSMQAALDNFLALSVRPKMVILGEMRELGIYSREEHQKLVERLVQNPIEQVFLVGESFQKIENLPMKWRIFPKTADLIEHLQTVPVSGYHILVKGSRPNQLEKVIPYL
ncbi:UDP-N-acetylmuramoyl-tripeptide--D-alanyl-D-alanine ligase [Bacteroidia bacterium]|nr:UDP-N-acetylmuramoyl-tripeptide--D-alanyl-D-alanine ligase [Bacteroidia bacterium]